MRLGLLTTSFPRHEGDPAGTFVLGFARALTARGHTVEVLAPEPAEPATLPDEPSISVRWVPYLRPRPLERTFYGAGVPDNLRRDPLSWLGVAPFVAALMLAARRASSEWDAVVSHFLLPSGLVASEIARGRPHLAVAHSADLHLLSRLPGHGVLAKRIARGASAMLFVSRSHRERFLSLLPPLTRSNVATRAHVCPMGIEGAPATATTAKRRRALRRSRDLDGFVALSMGRLVPIKGVDDAVRACVADGDSTLIVAGAGPERERLEAMAQRQGARARFVGVVAGEEKRALLECADAFILTSKPTPRGREEGVPTALLEAMDSGLAVIATDTGGVGSVVRHGENGLLVQPGDPAALGRALTELRTDPKLRKRLGRQAKKTGALYRWSEIAPRLEELLRDERSARLGEA